MMVLTKEIREAVKDRDRRIEALEKALRYISNKSYYSVARGWVFAAGYDPNVALNALDSDWKGLADTMKKYGIYPTGWFVLELTGVKDADEIAEFSEEEVARINAAETEFVLCQDLIEKRLRHID